MKRRDLEFETLVREALKGKKVPILVLDRRWHTLFPQGEKPAEIIQLEEKLNELLKGQGKHRDNRPESLCGVGKGQ